MLEHSESLAQIAEALAAAQAAFVPILKDKTAKIESSRTGKSFQYSYVDLATIMDAVRPHLAANGLAVVQDTALDNGAVQITTMLLHKSGEWLKGTLAMPCDTSDPRSVGIGATYGRRYHLQGMIGVAAETDTDAEGAGQSRPAARSERTETGEIGDVDLCPVHGTPWTHKVGVAKATGKPYDFWGCNERLDDGSYCQERPPKGYGTAKAAAEAPADAQGAETQPDAGDDDAEGRETLMASFKATIPQQAKRLTFARKWCEANNVPPPMDDDGIANLSLDSLIGIMDATREKAPA